MFYETPMRVSKSTIFEQSEFPPALYAASPSTDSNLLANVFDTFVLHMLAAIYWWSRLNIHKSNYTYKRQTRNLRVISSGFLSGEFGLRDCRDNNIKITCGWRVCLQYLFDAALVIARAG